jgi:outer membrane protein assembly factor BamB
MRRAALALLVAGLAVAIAVPFAWESRVPVLLGAALLAAAGLVARRPLAAAVGLVAAAALVFGPGLVDGWRNGRGIAWTVPRGEDLLLAEAGVAVTEDDDAHVLRARDIDSGAETWRLRLPGPRDDDGAQRAWRAGSTLLSVGWDGALRGIDLDRGTVRWTASAARTRFVGVTDGRSVALTRCPASGGCRVESLSLEDGSPRWTARASIAGEVLGVPVAGADQVEDGALWPAGFVVIPERPGSRRYVARDLTTGRVLARGSLERERTGMLGDVLVRAAADGALSAVDARSGRELWRRGADGPRAARSPEVLSHTLAMPGGALLLASGDQPIDALMLGDTLRLLDPRTGKLTERRFDRPGGITEVFATDRPASAAAGGALRPPALLWNDLDEGHGSELLVDGRTYRGERVRSVALTATQAGWAGTQHPWGSGARRVIEVHDRAGGARRVRFAADEAAVRSAGERLVIEEGDPEDPTVHVVAAG